MLISFAVLGKEIFSVAVLRPPLDAEVYLGDSSELEIDEDPIPFGFVSPSREDDTE